MDQRRVLNNGAIIGLNGMNVRIDGVIGMGSNAIVYKGSYEDGLNANMRHAVLVKELFPYDAKGGIFRNEEGGITVLAEAEENYLLHKKSFERGNEAHLRLLRERPDLIGGNINTASVNGTLYTILAESGGADFKRAERPLTLKIAAKRILSVLDALNAFHSSGLCHLDISPDNILLVGEGETERAMLIDYNSVFSLKEMNLGEGEYFSVKPGYTPPEIVNKNLSSVSFASDLYSVAAVFYTLISGETLSLFKMLSKNPPDVSETPLLKNAPETVKTQVRAILKKGLNALPGRRYRTIPEMREAFLELLNRIDMLGVTHAALWEAGKRNVQTLVRTNPFYEYLSEEKKMFPVRLEKSNGENCDVDAFVSELTGENGVSSICVSQGGTGKTTLLLKTALNLSKEYSPNRPAQLYVSLAGRAAQKKDLLSDAILENLRFLKDTVTYDGARHQLKTLLSSPLKTKAGDVPVLVLLLDGLNEIKGANSGLIEEIASLAALPGIRILITSRSDMEILHFSKCAVSPLEEKDIESALSLHGLLMPESEEIRSLLKTPLMLSVFIEASGKDGQLSVQREEELLAAYVSSLLTKEKEALGEEEAEKYRVEAAVKYVLPALSEAMIANGGALSDGELFRAARKCRKTLVSRYLSHAFPAWLGHRREISMQTEDEFYGKFVHEILWKRMGLLIRDEQSLRVSHARIGEYLSGIHAENRKRILKRLVVRYSVMTALGAAAVCLAVAAVLRWAPARTVNIIQVAQEKKRSAYDDGDMLNYMEYAVTGYSSYGALYDMMTELIEKADAGEQIGFDTFYENHLRRIEDAAVEKRSVTSIINKIEKMKQKEGEVCSWSDREVDFDSAAKLVLLERTCAEIYAAQLPVYKFWLENDDIREYYVHNKKLDYGELLKRLLSADAETAALMFQVTGAAHLNGMKDENAIAKDTYIELIADMDEIEQMRPEIYGEEAAIRLRTAEKKREEALTELRRLSGQLEMEMKKNEGKQK